MEENNVVSVAEKPKASKPSFGEKVKEFFRKQTIKLKRKPQNIAFIMVIVSCAYNLLTLGTYSEGIISSGAFSDVDWVGLMVFVNTLFSLLSVVAFMNSFPKLKKQGSKVTKTISFTKATKININLLMFAVFIVFAILMIVCECVYYSMMSSFYSTSYYVEGVEMTEKLIGYAAIIKRSLSFSIGHIVLVAIDIVLACLTPVFGILLAKIDTNKEIESAVGNMQELDLASED